MPPVSSPPVGGVMPPSSGGLMPPVSSPPVGGVASGEVVSSPSSGHACFAMSGFFLPSHALTVGHASSLGSVLLRISCSSGSLINCPTTSLRFGSPCNGPFSISALNVFIASGLPCKISVSSSGLSSNRLSM